MRQFRKLPIVIEAIQLTEENIEEVAELCNGSVGDTMIFLTTLEGVMYAQFGDWIIKGVNGEFYPCKPDKFEKTYEALCKVISVSITACKPDKFEKTYEELK